MIDLNAALWAHIVSGALAVAVGAVALAARKGASIHIGAGRIFVLAMGASSALGAGLGLARMDTFYITFHAGVLAITLLLSGWLTARARSRDLGHGSLAVGAVNFLNLASLVVAGLYALSLPGDALLGFHAGNYFFLSGMAGVAAVGDLSLIFRRQLSERHRIARHLWRMCLGFFIAAGSAFTGPGATAFPEAIRNSGILSLPELLIILLTLFWLAHTLFLRRTPAPEAKS